MSGSFATAGLHEIVVEIASREVNARRASPSRGSAARPPFCSSAGPTWCAALGRQPLPRACPTSTAGALATSARRPTPRPSPECHPSVAARRRPSTPAWPRNTGGTSGPKASVSLARRLRTGSPERFAEERFAGRGACALRDRVGDRMGRQDRAADLGAERHPHADATRGACQVVDGALAELAVDRRDLRPGQGVGARRRRAGS